MPDDPTENTPWREGENYDEMMSEEPFDDEVELDAEEAEQRITQFIMSAEELPGPPLEELAEQVAALMQAALRDLEKLNNKVLATQLLLGQRARELQQYDPEQWHLRAAMTCGDESPMNFSVDKG